MVEFLTFMLVEINGLNKEKDIDPWIKVSEGDLSDYNRHPLLLC